MSLTISETVMLESTAAAVPLPIPSERTMCATERWSVKPCQASPHSLQP